MAIDHGCTAPAATAGAGTATHTTVLIVWSGYRPGPWAARSLAAAGYRVIASHPTGAAGGRSTACLAPRRYPPPADEASFLGWLARTCRDRGVAVVLPLDEDVVRLLAERAPDLNGAVVAGPDGRQFHALCDKLELAATAAAAGVDHPHSIEVGPDGPDGPWPPLPSIVKPRTSISDARRAPVLAVRTEAQRTRAIDHLLEAGITAVVQEQIVGQAWVLHCVRGAHGTGMVAARVTTTYPRVVGTSSVSTVVPPPPGLAEAATRLLDAVDYRGPCCMNLLERDGRYYFHDVNLRLAASVGAAVAAGFDQPRHGVEAALGRFRPPVGTAIRSITYVPMQGEGAALADAIGARIDERPWDIARRMLAAAVAPGRQLDPPLRDPLWLARSLAAGAGRAAGRVVRGG